MADEKLNETDEDDLEIVEVDEIPTEPVKKAAPEEDTSDEDDDSGDSDEGDEEDSRLAISEDDEDDQADPKEDNAARKKRLKRRQLQKEARARQDQRLAFLEQQNAELLRRVSGVEGANLDTSEATVDQRINEVRRDIAQADRILAAAIANSNGDDAAAALALRDEARAAEAELLRTKNSFDEVRKQPRADPSVDAFRNQWMSDNRWFNPAGADPASMAIKAIDAQVAKDGYNPASAAYWQELSRRASQAFNQGEKKPVRDKPNGAAKKTPPPQGSTREHASQSTRKEVYVTPDRKQAMIDAGLWDDPKERAATLKAYAEYDREESANR